MGAYSSTHLGTFTRHLVKMKKDYLAQAVSTFLPWTVLHYDNHEKRGVLKNYVNFILLWFPNYVRIVCMCNQNSSDKFSKVYFFHECSRIIVHTFFCQANWSKSPNLFWHEFSIVCASTYFQSPVRWQHIISNRKFQIYFHNFI